MSAQNSIEVKHITTNNAGVELSFILNKSRRENNNIPILIQYKLLKNLNKSQALKRTPKITDTNSILRSALSL